MKALDTNVLVRYLTRDDPKQTAKAEVVIEECRSTRDRLFVPMLVLCETAWVLDRSYGQDRASVARILKQILETDLFHIEGEGIVRQSIVEFSTGKGSFSDYVIGNIARNAGCDETVTFDRALKNHRNFKLLV